ncbi:hypothetical protein L3M27_004523 [Escherichia coli]|nr:hypothetical protein [Escherichia coli]
MFSRLAQSSIKAMF